MGGFNTSVFIGQPKAVAAAYTASWDDQLNLATCAHLTFSCTLNSNDVAARASWSDQARIISVWKAQGCDAHGGGTVLANLNDATASVTIYAANFGTLASGATGNITGNPLATYTLPMNNVLKSVDNGSGSFYSGAAFLFSSVPSGASSYDFNGSSDLVCDAVFHNMNVLYQPTAHTGVIASFAAQKSLQLWKVQFANASDDRTSGCVARSCAEVQSFKLYNSTDAVIIYTVSNTTIGALATQTIIGTPLTTYTLPANKNLSIDLVSSGILQNINYDDLISVGMVMSCT